MQDLNDLFFFAQVVEHGSFTGAARALGMPKSTVSRRVALLEKRLDTRLLHRTTRRLSLTDIGRVYYSHCQTVLAAADAADEAVLQVHSEPRGLIRVSCPVSLCQSLMVKAVPEFMARYPQVRILLEATNRRVDLVEEGIDVAIRVRTRLEDSSLVLRQFVFSRMVLAAGPGLLETYGTPEHPIDLSRYPTLSLNFVDGRYYFNLESEQHGSLSISHEPSLITDEMLVLREAAIAGQGITALPAFLCHEALASGQLVRVLPEWSLPQGVVHAVYPYRRGMLPAVRHFIDYLATRLPELAEEYGIVSVGR